MTWEDPDRTGRTFGNLTVLRLSRIEKPRKINVRYWICQCASCGREFEVSSIGLGRDHETICQCVQPTLAIWCAMRGRCRTKTATNYRYYGGRGIKVCDRWLSFSSFLQDMGPAPGDEYSIERKDNSLGYEPGNCEWMPMRDQSRHRRMFRNNTSGATGVWQNRSGKWAARVGAEYIGSFASFTEAVSARAMRQQELGYHPEHGRQT